MLKNDIIKRLERLQGLEKIEVIMHDGTCRIVTPKYLKNFENEEILESDMDNFKAFYCSIALIRPIS